MRRVKKGFGDLLDSQGTRETKVGIRRHFYRTVLLKCFLFVYLNEVDQNSQSPLS